MAKPRLKQDELTRRVCIAMHPSEANWIKALGGGNLSKGIREIIKVYRAAKTGGIDGSGK